MKIALSNCRPPEKIEKSFWEIYFGWKPEVKNIPDPCTCRVSLLNKKLQRSQDPRLCDPRYKSTSGDVLIFTEHPKPEVCKKLEPQPKPPPAYKLPKAVLTKRILEKAEKNPHSNATEIQYEMSCVPKCSVSKAQFSLFEVLRAPDRRRKNFSCKNGIRSEDVAKPIRKHRNICVSKTSADFISISGQREAVKSSKDYLQLPDVDSENILVHNARKTSRTEQLKKLTETKEDDKCSQLLKSSIEQISIRPSTCDRSRKMSTLSSSYESSV